MANAVPAVAVIMTIWAAEEAEEMVQWVRVTVESVWAVMEAPARGSVPEIEFASNVMCVRDTCERTTRRTP